ncbi:MAG: prepilin-type cleavage/methylation domain-containing protein [Thermoflavifilum sp.]|nr:prepilin-type cleavage/methylation domain-containing protein [Thermoflavifilum sp.]MCL6513989.1 prepilin-type cleavage/methylation domain-containing protein [Alicyclobacillus sp.]
MLELVIALAVTSALTLTILPCVLRSYGHWQLVATAERLAWKMRWAQTQAQVTDQGAVVRLFPYTPQYWVYVGGDVVSQSTFDPGVMYRGGYLQMSSGFIAYDVLGTSTVGGVVSLVDGSDQVDVHLYMGSGLQVVGDGP